MNSLHSDTILVSMLFASLTIIATTVSTPVQQRGLARQNGAHDERYRILIKKSERKLYLYSQENGKERLDAGMRRA
jgi:murein L,D-transpeptidase YafK